MERIIECVPNFSEGRDIPKVEKIVAEIESVNGVKVLHVDTGFDANRTVITFAGEPQAVCNAAFNAIKLAGEIIDMSKHEGKHPRIGATDVCPLVPVKGVSMEETVELARKLAEKVGAIGIPVYCYENAAFVAERKNLAYCRKGEYERLKEKLPIEKPDFGPDSFNARIARTGLSVIGARSFLIAVNFNLNTKSVKIAAEIAQGIREKGNGAKLKGVKAIGWYIDDFGIAQVSVNITDINATALHTVYEEVKKRATLLDVEVTGTEIIGLIPEKVIIDAGAYFMSKSGDNKFEDNVLIAAAIQHLGLNDLSPFIPEEKILEYVINI